MVKICKKNSKPLANFEDGRKSLILAESAKRSLKSKKFEKIIDDESPNRDKRVIVESINKVNLSDFLIIKNWLNYAEIIGDQSFGKIYKTKKKL